MLLCKFVIGGENLLALFLNTPQWMSLSFQTLSAFCEVLMSLKFAMFLKFIWQHLSFATKKFLLQLFAVKNFSVEWLRSFFLPQSKVFSVLVVK